MVMVRGDLVEGWKKKLDHTSYLPETPSRYVTGMSSRGYETP
jgi:hypothetical protein